MILILSFGSCKSYGINVNSGVCDGDSGIGTESVKNGSNKHLSCLQFGQSKCEQIKPENRSTIILSFCFLHICIW